LANAIDKYKQESTSALNQAIETLVLLLAPFTPHLSEELWKMMGKEDPTVSKVAWPIFDPKALELDSVNYAVQINGKVRSQFTASVTATNEELQKLCLADPNVARYVEGATIKKFIVVPKKLVSIVV
jgi:leucyl-tRNA synthetase